MSTVALGIENLTTQTGSKRIQGKKVGLLAHPASTDSSLTSTIDLLADAGASIEILFGPEHGFVGDAQDMESVEGTCPGPGGIPLISLYGSTEDTLAPSPDQLRGLDYLVVDLFDVGSRYYTFVWTTVLCLRTCHEAGVKMLLCDRPNPLGGLAVEGAPQDSNYLSFVGLKSVANRHGLTVGEIVSMAAAEEKLTDALNVIQMTGWKREMLFDTTGLPWILPSPNMPTLETALLYPGMCLIEGTWASEGRGTTKPFEFVGAPQINGENLAKRLDKMNLPGVRFRPISFKPGFQKHSGTTCGGVQLHITEVSRLLPYLTGVAVILAMKSEAGDSFAWRHDPYEFVTDRPAIDLLTGSPHVREAVEAGAELAEIALTWTAKEADFKERRAPFLLY
jgi:uncharacterized protein YbbC (DUF1343 family)